MVSILTLHASPALFLIGSQITLSFAKSRVFGIAGWGLLMAAQLPVMYASVFRRFPKKAKVIHCCAAHGSA